MVVPSVCGRDRQSWETELSSMRLKGYLGRKDVQVVTRDGRRKGGWRSVVGSAEFGTMTWSRTCWKRAKITEEGPSSLCSQEENVILLYKSILLFLCGCILILTSGLRFALTIQDPNCGVWRGKEHVINSKRKPYRPITSNLLFPTTNRTDLLNSSSSTPSNDDFFLTQPHFTSGWVSPVLGPVLRLHEPPPNACPSLALP
jgi:hypothetical protein